MSLYTRKEFAALCRTTTAVVTTNINRGKIVLFDKKIDSENRINKAFFDKYHAKAEAELKKKNKAPEKTTEQLYDEVVEKVPSKVKFKKAKDKLKAQAEKEAARQKAIEEGEEIMDWEKRKKIADALLQERKAEKEQLALEKLAGKLIPTDLAFNIIRIHNQSIFATFQNDTENLASKYCDILAAGDRKKLSKIMDEISHAINDSIKRAEEVAMSGIENAIEEYSDTRNRGERK